MVPRRRKNCAPWQRLLTETDTPMSIFEGFLSTSETLAAFSDRNFVDAMLRFEAALARAQAKVGLIPESAAHSIVGSCKVELFDVAKIVRESGRAGSVAIP